MGMSHIHRQFFFSRVDELTTWSSNIGVLQTTVAEVVTVEAHQRTEPVFIRVLRMLTPDSAGLLHHAICMVSWVSLAIP
jgi:hypothetical protein